MSMILRAAAIAALVATPIALAAPNRSPAIDGPPTDRPVGNNAHLYADIVVEQAAPAPETYEATEPEDEESGD